MTSLEQSKEPLVSCTVLIFASQKFTVHFVRLGADSGERGGPKTLGYGTLKAYFHYIGVELESHVRRMENTTI